MVWCALIAVILGVAVPSCSGGGGSRPAGTPGESAATPQRSWAGTEPAPGFPPGLTWFNVATPPSLESLRGRVVLLDFWTLGCINCQHIVPDLKRLEAEFGPALAVIGVHSGKYTTEQDDESIREAARRLGLEHAIVNDPDFAFWQTYGANAWPTLVLIDPAGKIAGFHAGEGVYGVFQPIIASLVQEFDARGMLVREPLPLVTGARVASTVLSYPGDVLADGRAGRLFIADSGHNRIIVTSLSGELKLVVGSGAEGFADGGPREASFRQPQGLALSADGDTLYVADTRNHAIRAVTLATGAVATIAGTGRQLERLPANGAPAATTAMASPWDLLVDGSQLFIAMAGVHQLWAIDLEAATVSVFAGTSREGIEDGPRRTMATLAQPSALASDGRYLYWADPESSAVRRTVISGPGDVETLVGTGLFEWGDEDGVGRSARLQHPQGITYADGLLYVADTYNHRTRSVDPLTRTVTTVAGLGERGFADGPAALALLNEPGGISSAGHLLYIADTNNHVIRVLDPQAKSISTLALSNLALAGPPAGRVARITRERVEAAAGGSMLRIEVRAPAGYKLNSLGASSLTLVSGNPAVVALGESQLSWSSDLPGVNIPVPVNLGPGETAITATATIYYCRAGEEELCLIQQVEVVLPVLVTPTAAAGEIPLTIDLSPLE